MLSEESQRLPYLRSCFLCRLAAAGGLLVLGPGFMVLLALTLTRANTADHNAILLEGRPQDAVLQQASAAREGSVVAQWSTVAHASTITIQRMLPKFRHKSRVTCDPNSGAIVQSRDILMWGLNIVRVDTERTPEGFVIDIRAGTQHRTTVLPLAHRAGLWHGETLPFLIPCLKEEAPRRQIAVFEPSVGRVCATQIIPAPHGRWRCTNDVRSLSIVGIDHRLQSFRETQSGITREFIAGEDHSEKTAP